eukprot:1159719-Pelagomonas_calceolata.AAC.8
MLHLHRQALMGMPAQLAHTSNPSAAQAPTLAHTHSCIRAGLRLCLQEQWQAHSQARRVQQPLALKRLPFSCTPGTISDATPYTYINNTIKYRVLPQHTITRACLGAAASVASTSFASPSLSTHMRSCGVSAMGVNRTPPVAAAGRGGLPPPSSSQSIHARSVRGGSLSMWSLSAEVAVHAAADSGGTAAA